MRSFLVALATVSLVVGVYSASPAADDKKLTPQQEKMKSCNAEAGDKKGDERKPSRVVPGPWKMRPPRPRWLVTCSCGWGRECISRWAAESVVKLHPRRSTPDVGHIITIHEPPAAVPSGTQLPLT